MRIDDDILQQLSAYMDDELPPEEADRIAALVASEPALREELRRLRATRELLRSLPAESPADGFTERVVGKATAGRQAGRPVLFRLLAAAAAVLVIAGAGVIALYHGPGTGPGPGRDDRELASRAGDEVERGIPRESTGSRRRVEVRKGAAAPADRMKARAAAGAVAAAEKDTVAAGAESFGAAKLPVVSGGSREAAPAPDRLVIYAADLAGAVEKTQTVFRSSEVRVVDSSRAASAERKERKPARPESVDFTVYGTDSQLEEIRHRLDSRIRAESTVSQLPEHTYNRLLASLDRDAERGEVRGRLSAVEEDKAADVMRGKGGAGAAKKMPAKAAPVPRPKPAGFAGTAARRNEKNAGMTDDTKRVAAAPAPEAPVLDEGSKKAVRRTKADAGTVAGEKANDTLAAVTDEKSAVEKQEVRPKAKAEIRQKGPPAAGNGAAGQTEETAQTAAGPRNTADTAYGGGMAAQVAVDGAVDSEAVQRVREPAAPAAKLKPTALAEQKKTESRPASEPAPLRTRRKEGTMKAMVVTLRYRSPVSLTEAQKARLRQVEARLMNRAAMEADVEAQMEAAESEAKE